jgi:hypothetical protein
MERLHDRRKYTRKECIKNNVFFITTITLMGIHLALTFRTISTYATPENFCQVGIPKKREKTVNFLLESRLTADEHR